MWVISLPITSFIFVAWHRIACIMLSKQLFSSTALLNQFVSSFCSFWHCSAGFLSRADIVSLKSVYSCEVATGSLFFCLHTNTLYTDSCQKKVLWAGPVRDRFLTLPVFVVHSTQLQFQQWTRTLKRDVRFYLAVILLIILAQIRQTCLHIFQRLMDCLLFLWIHSLNEQNWYETNLTRHVPILISFVNPKHRRAVCVCLWD